MRPSARRSAAHSLPTRTAMPAITFHHGATDKLLAACRLIQAYFRTGRKILVYTPDPALAEHFDVRLWSFASLSFVPHCRYGSPHQPETPVLIAPSTAVAGFDDILFNLANDLPPGFERYRDIIEIVSTGADDAGNARQRFRRYKELGYPPLAQACTASPT